MKIKLHAPYRRAGMSYALPAREYDAQDPRVKRFVQYWLQHGFAIVTEQDETPQAAQDADAEAKPKRTPRKRSAKSNSTG